MPLKVIFSVIFGIAILSLLAPFVEIPIIDDWLEYMNQQYPKLSGFLLVAMGGLMFASDLKDGHPVKSFKIGDRIRDIIIVGLGAYQILGEMINH